MSDQPSLFGETSRTPRPDVDLWSGYFAGKVDLNALVEAVAADQLVAVMAGQRFRVPRLEAWWGSRPYRFGGRVVQPRTGPWPQFLWQIKSFVENKLLQRFDSCFVNVYRDGNDCITWHADDEEWIGDWIASVSFGAARRFVMRSKADHKNKHTWLLADGDVLVMGPSTQAKWEHTVPRTMVPTGVRVNLTFRQTRKA